jgi:hypothetical protein
VWGYSARARRASAISLEDCGRERVSRNDVEQVVNQAGDRHVTLRSLAPKGHDEFVLKLYRSVRALWVFVFGLGAHRRQ